MVNIIKCLCPSYLYLMLCPMSPTFLIFLFENPLIIPYFLTKTLLIPKCRSSILECEACESNVHSEFLSPISYIIHVSYIQVEPDFFLMLSYVSNQTINKTKLQTSSWTHKQELITSPSPRFQHMYSLFLMIFRWSHNPAQNFYIGK